MSHINLESSDGIVFKTELEIAKVSGTIRRMLEDCGLAEDDDSSVPLANVDSIILQKIIEWSAYHLNDPSPKEGEQPKNSNNISKWDAKFLDVDQSTLFKLILAANYLDIRGLLDAACKTVANMMKGKNAEAIRQTFNIENDLKGRRRINKKQK